MSPNVPGYLKSRWRRSELQHRNVRESVRALNEVHDSRCADFHGAFDAARTPSAPSNPRRPIPVAAASALQHIWNTHVRNVPPRHAKRGLGALTELIKSRDIYSLEATTVAPYDETQLNIFRSSQKRHLTELQPLLQGREAKWWEKPSERLLLPPAEREAALGDPDLPQPYWDETLRKDRAQYVSFVRRLCELGLVTYRKQSRAKVGVFFVYKKQNADGTYDIRMILDCRRSNACFHRPPRTELVGGGKIGEVHLPNGKRYFIASSDVRDCFYSFAQHEELVEYFGMEPVTAEEACVSSVDGEEVSGDSEISPCFCSLPMGFSWALHMAQHGVSGATKKAKEGHRVRDMELNAPPPELLEGEVHRGVYVDNVILGGHEAWAVQEHHDHMQVAFDGIDGLDLHDHAEADVEADVLGYHLREGKELGNARKRMWRFTYAVKHLLGWRKMSGKLMEVVLGHFVSLALGNRWLLCIPSECYRFAAENGGKWVELPGRIRQELRWMIALLPLGRVTMANEYSTLLTVSDASGEDGGYGYGLCETVEEEQEKIHDAAKIKERWRFR